MTFLRLLFSLIFTILIAFGSYAQRTEAGESESGDDEATKKAERSPDSVFVSYFSLNEQGAYTRTAVSKPLNQFQEYDITKQNNQLFSTLGNPGSAAYPLLFNFKATPNFRFRSDVFEPYKLKDDSIKFYISDSPF